MKSRNLSVMMLSVCLMGVAVWRQATVRGQAQDVQAARAARQDQPVERYEEAGRADAARPRWAEDALAQSRAFLKGEAEFNLVAAEQDDLGQTHVRLAQQYRGLPVFGVQVVTHTGAKGMWLSGRPFEGRDLDIKPILTPAQAIEAAQASLRYLGQFGHAAEPALVVLPHELFDRNDATGATLAYQVELPGPDGAVLRSFIDARTGRVVWHYNHTPVDNHERGAVELIQANESGALDVSFAGIQAVAKNEGDERIVEQAVRKMAAPAIDHYSKLLGGSNCVPIAGNDNCWVRENGGIQNKAFFLLAEGGTHAVSEITVNGIGRDKAEMIFRRALRALSPNAQFADAREESVRAAADLFGAGSYEQVSTGAAWRAVGVNSSAACTVTAVPMITIPQEGGQSTIPVTVSSQSCAWEVGNVNSWITIVSGASGVGNGSMTISVGPNPTNDPTSRVGDLAVLGKFFAFIKQSKNACTIADISVGQTVNGELSKSDCYVAGLPYKYRAYGDDDPFRYVDVYDFVGAAGQPITISMNSSAIDSYLKLQRNIDNYSTIATADDYRGTLHARIPGTGNFVLPATGRYTIWVTTAPKAAPSQTGAYTLTLTTTCAYSLSSNAAAHWSSGGTGTFNVTTPGNCGWSAKSNVSWITITNGMYINVGNGPVAYAVAANPNSLGRSGTITIQGRTFTVTQQGAN